MNMNNSTTNSNIPAIPVTYADVLRLIASQHEQLEAAQLQIEANQRQIEENLRPIGSVVAKAEVYDSIVANNGKIMSDTAKAEVYDRVIANKYITLTDFVRMLNGLKLSKLRSDLAAIGYLYRNSKGGYSICPEYENVLFGLSPGNYYAKRRKGIIIVLDKGKQLLCQLHNDGKLTLKAKFER